MNSAMSTMSRDVHIRVCGIAFSSLSLHRTLAQRLDVLVPIRIDKFRAKRKEPLAGIAVF